jgi:cell division septal protein FtsQ
MKEQVITPRAGRSAAAGKGRAGEMPQRPTRRERGGASASRAKTKGWRKALAYLPLIGKITLAVVIGVLLFTGYRAAASASFFQARNVDVSGAARASKDEIKTIVLGAAKSGVWNADLNAISREVKKIGWVKEAVVSRVLPDGLRVRVIEREPRAVVRMNAGNFVWVDEEAVTLGAASPADRIFMRGWDEKDSDSAREQNRERVQKFLEIVRELDAQNLSQRISEINFEKLFDVRAQLTGNDSQVELKLGRDDLANRLKRGLNLLDKNRDTPVGPFIIYINTGQGAGNNQGGILGLSRSAPDFQRDITDPEAPEIEREKVATRTASKPPDESRKPKEKEKVARQDDVPGRRKDQAKKEQAKREKDKKDKASREVRAESRPRRVG